MLKKCPKIILNSFVGIVASIISTLSTYIIRIIISHNLGDEIYGVNSIFISIVSVFLILELGMSTAMIITMYKPVSLNDKEKIKSILLFYRNFYRVFCAILLILGIFISIFLLESFMKTSIDINHVKIYFFLYLFSIIFKYLWSYKSCLLYANKLNSVVSFITILVTLFFSIIEIISIIILKNYWIYLILFLFHNISINAFCNIYVNKKYPFVKGKNVIKLDIDSKHQVKSIIKPMFIQRIANQLQDASSIIIFTAIGASAVTAGYFSNYIMVVHACQTIFSQIGSAFTTSFGSFSVENENVLKKYQFYKTSRFFMSWVAIVFSSLYLCLIQPFIILFFGEGYCLQNLTAIIFACYVFIILNNIVNLSIQNAVGAHYLDTKEMILQTIIGIGLSIVLGVIFDSTGVILGMLISIIIFSSFIKGFKIYKHIFMLKGYSHLLLFFKEVFCFILVSGTLYLFCIFVLKPTGLVQFFISAVLVFILANIELLVINLHSKEIGLFKNAFFRKIKNK